MTVASQWWTVFAVYDDTQEAFVHFAHAKDPEAAWKKALAAAEGPIHKAGIVPGKVAPVEEEDKHIIPIRGKGHAIKVSSVYVTTKEIVIPGRCPGCKSDTRKTGALLESNLVPRKWHAHLSHNGKDLSSERDGRCVDGRKIIETTAIMCTACERAIWDGVDYAK